MPAQAVYLATFTFGRLDGRRALAPLEARIGERRLTGRFPLALALSRLLVEASFRTFERWFLRRKGRWAR
ncbi:MAG: hypothetical protein FJ301_01420 [Planctomycetes bacterium]|nr:hypothetical protein [Planctomycetota bacterium]